VSRGHRRMAVLRPPYEARDAQLRIDSLRAHLRDHGVSVPESWIRVSGERADGVLTELLAEGDPPTAIFCWHDRLAYGVLESCERLGIDVPDRLSIVGYDGLHWPAHTRHVAASVLVDPNAMAHTAVRVLDRYINGYVGPVLEETVAVTFSPGTTLSPATSLHRSKI